MIYDFFANVSVSPYFWELTPPLEESFSLAVLARKEFTRESSWEGHIAVAKIWLKMSKPIIWDTIFDIYFIYQASVNPKY